MKELQSNSILAVNDPYDAPVGRFVCAKSCAQCTCRSGRRIWNITTRKPLTKAREA